MIIGDESVREFVDRILADPPPAVTKQSDIEMTKTYRTARIRAPAMPAPPSATTGVTTATIGSNDHLTRH